MALATGPSIQPVTDETPALLDLFINMFLAIFPTDSRYTQHFRDCARIARIGHPRKVYHLWLLQVGGDYVGFRFFTYLRQANLGFGGYVGLLPAYRHQGLGRFLQAKALEQIADDAAADHQPIPIGLCAEMADPTSAATVSEKRDREQRYAIFKKLGVIPLDVDYLEPPAVQGMSLNQPDDLRGIGPRPAVLFLAPLQPIRTVDADLTAQLVKTVYRECYQLDENSWYVQRALNSIYHRIA